MTKGAVEVTLFAEYNKDETKKNVEQILKKIPNLLRIAGETPQITASYELKINGKGKTHGDSIGDHLSRKAEAQDLLDSIMFAINSLNGYSRQILILKYVDYRFQSDIMVYSELYLPERSYYRMLDNALLEFSEAYNHGELMIY